MNEKFANEVRHNIQALGSDLSLHKMTMDWMCAAGKYNYVYNFSWLGRPIIQFPQDIVAFQEIVWKVQPDLIIETGIAHGGSVLLSASMLALLEKCNCIEKGRVVAVDIDIREHNRTEIERHPLNSYIIKIEGSSIDEKVVDKIKYIAKDYKRILVCLDSNHTHEHVLNELKAYAPLVTKDSYCIVYDTSIEDTPDEFYQDRPWCKGNNPKTAVWEYLKTNKDFEIDKTVQNKTLVTAAPDGFLKKIN